MREYVQFPAVFQPETGFLYADVHSLVFTGHIVNDKAIVAWSTSVKGHALAVAIVNVPR